MPRTQALGEYPPPQAQDTLQNLFRALAVRDEVDDERDRHSHTANASLPRHDTTIKSNAVKA
jgi:hypothetical protein